MTKLIIFIVPFFLLALEYFLEWRSLRARDKALFGGGPYYPWAYYTRSGTRFAFWRGFLQLELSPALIYRNRPNQKTPFFSINSQGFRGPELSPEGRGGRIVLQGSSTAFGTGLAADAESLGQQLENKLGMEVVNAAVIGHRSGQELAYLSTELLQLKPDLVLALTGWNDFSQYWLCTWEHPPIGFNAFELIDDQVADSQRLLSASLPRRCLSLPGLLFPVLGRKIRLALRRPQQAVDLGPKGADWKIPLLVEKFVRNVELAAALARFRGARHLCILQPVRSVAAGKEGALLAHYREFRRLARERFARSGLAYVDLNENEGRIPDEQYIDLTHLDREGHRQLADRLAVEIKKVLA